MTLPKQYEWLLKETGPRILLEGLKIYGTAETEGPGNNPSIMAWAKVTGLDRQYANDSVAWCGLAMAYVALQAGWDLPVNPLGARNWLTWGTAKSIPALGDILVFWREKPTGWKGHVGMYVGEDDECYHVLGGNQANRVSIKRIEKTRLLGARRCPWRVNQPVSVRPVRLKAVGALSRNEA
jgi:uncharacterized protein (TIGR02594 family)